MMFRAFKQRFAEELVLFYAVVKWTVLALISGVVVGAAVALFVKLLNLGIGVTGAAPSALGYVLLPIGLVASTVMVRYLAPDASGHGTEKVVEAVHERAGKIDLKVVPVKMITTIITVSCGGSAGKEGPSTQIAAGLMSALGTFMKFSDYDRKRIVVCGISAGFAAVFGTPVAGAVFALEVLYIGQILYDVIFPAFLSGVVAWRTALMLGLEYESFPIAAAHLPAFTLANFGWTVLAGVFFGLVSLCTVEIMNGFEGFFHKLKTSIVVKALLGAVMILALAYFVGGEYFGLSDRAMAEILRGRSVPYWGWLWKIMLTAITLSCGGSGGVVTPIFYIGAAAGAAFAQFFGLDTVAYASWGLVAVLAGSANAPVSATVMAAEFLGAQALPFAAIACVTSFMIVGHRSVYPTQLIARAKSPVLELTEAGGRIDKKGMTVLALRRIRFFADKTENGE